MKTNVQYVKSRMPPMDRKGATITSIKDIFKLIDDFGKKGTYDVEWDHYFMFNDWCWIAPRVQRELKNYPDIGISFRRWEGNLARKTQGKGKKDFFEEKGLSFKKKAKLLGIDTGNLTYKNDLFMRVFNKTIVLAVSEDVGENWDKSFKRIQSILRILKGKSKQLENIPAPRKITVELRVLQDSRKWVCNYERGIVELNMSQLFRLPVARSAYYFLIAIGLAYLPLMLRTNKNKWFRFFKRKPFPVREKFIPNQLTKAHQGFAIGLADIAFEYPTFSAEGVRDFFDIFTPKESEEVNIEDIPDISPMMIETVRDCIDEFETDFPYIATPSAEDISGLLGLAEVGETSFFENLDWDADSIVAMATSFGGEDSITIESQGWNNQQYLGGVTEEEGFYVARTIIHKEGKLTLENDVFHLPKAYQGYGTGVKMIGRQIEWCLENNVSEIRCHAARDDGHYIGYKIWHKMGYDGDISASKTMNKDEFANYLKECHRIKIMENYLLEDLQEWLNNCFLEVVRDRKPTLITAVPEQFLYEVDDRYSDLRYGDAQGGFEEIVQKFSREDILEFWENVMSRKDWGRFNVSSFFSSMVTDSVSLQVDVDTIQNLMDVYGFETWWADNGKSWGASLDLSEGRESDAFLIFSLYQQKKGLGKMASDGFAKTKAMGVLSLRDIELFDQARKEVRAQKKQSARIASKWLA